MDALSPVGSWQHTRIRVGTRQPVDFVDLTDRLAQLCTDARIGVGILSVQTRHTTTAIVVNEHEHLLLEDFREMLERTAPAAGSYKHDQLWLRSNVPPDEPRNGQAHCRALLLPTSATIHIVDGQLALGRWQRIFLLDLDGPRQRDVSVVVFGEATP
jgi:secondary thiamine-phosphate synthase enzyme